MRCTEFLCTDFFWNHNYDSMAGLTTQLRNEINVFKDEKIWKQFTARRLNLIETEGLYKKKAKEQDAEIVGVTKILMEEFNIGPDKSGNVNKLVKAAIQSTRRNRKRGLGSVEDVIKITHFQPKRIKLAQPDSTKQQERFINDILNVEQINEEPTYDYNKKQAISNSDITVMAMNKFIEPATANNVANFVESQRRLLNLIKKSKTCASSTYNSLVISKESNIYHLGKSCVPLGISYLLCKSKPQSNSSSEYLRIKLNSKDVLSRVIKSLDSNPDINMMNEEVATDTLYYILGCIIVDFELNQVVELLGVIFHEIIRNEFPMIEMQAVERNDDFEKLVTIKFNDKFLNFKHNSQTAALPTRDEIISNCQQAFGLKNKLLSLTDMDQNLISKDQDLKRLFEGNQTISLKLEILNTRLEKNPYEIRGVQSYARRNTKLKYTAPKFEKLL